ncbi:AAA family ATPase [Nocardioides sp. CER19]|uniref:helix-turn-helix transcriptional regulator n=1 Tax=Nocardioides sp. CER19 TaxID=3038538 RepID=UPI00244999E0|nr:AAA family ATPase [Nocardioides sp. CER19]MDH2413904.1 AAA family ATPase [Nocardioides sp. CER19]
MDHVIHVVEEPDAEAGLVGREREQQQLGLLLGHARNGQGGSVLVVGEPGIGKTALLEATSGNAEAMQVLRVAGFESESTMPYAALQRLCIPLRDHLAALPGRQQDALLVAAGVADGPPPDRFLVGLGILGLLTTAATTEAVLCVVDDAHLLDQESLDALAFVARRIEVEPVAMLFAARDSSDVSSRLNGVRELRLAGLRMDAAVKLLTRSMSEPIDPVAAVQVAHAMNGNPLALIDLAQEVSTRQLEDLALADDPLPVGPRLEAHYLHKVRAADDPVQNWLLLAAADSTGNIGLVRSAARLLDLSDDTADRAELAGLVDLIDSVQFHHPLARSAVYNAATGAQRRRVHGALARAAELLGLVQLEAWHASRATVGPDPGVADRLEAAADLSAARGGLASRSSLLARAAELSLPGRQRAGRLVGAAEAALAVGAIHSAQSHLAAVDRAITDPVVRGRVAVVETSIALFTVDASRLARCTADLVQAAEQFRGREPAREQDALLRAFQLFMTAETRAEGITTAELGAHLTAGAEARSGPYATILRGMGALVQLPYSQGVPLVRMAYDELAKLPDRDLVGMGAAIGALGMYLWDGAGRRDLLTRATDAARAGGALQDLDTLLWVESIAELWGGSVRRSVEAVENVREVRRTMGYDAENVINASVMAWSDYPREVVHAIGEGAAAVGFGGVWSAAVAALATRDLAEGRYDDAYEKLRPLVLDPFLQTGPSYFPDFVEAAVRSDRPAAALPVLADLEDRARLNGSDWCAGVAARARGIASTGPEAAECFRSAIELLNGTEARVELGRTHLVYGEWLRRTRRRADAGRQLILAAETLDQAGASMFLPRVRAELTATGMTSDAGERPPRHDLTPQELTIAHLASDGHTNAEIGAQLFISPNTVDYHLRKVFQKLAISSRRQLSEHLDFLET